MLRSLEIATRPDIDYPTSDVRTMAETDDHRNAIVELIDRLQLWYADTPTHYVSGNLLVFYKELDRRAHFAGCVRRQRRRELIAHALLDVGGGTGS